jgi:O-antigen/teichoic acid export membrane protein
VHDIKQRVLRGGVAKIGAQATTFTIRIASMVVMARLLDPAEFGLVAMVGAVTGVFNVLRDAGLSRATIQRETVTDEQLSTLFWMNVLLGLALTVAFAALAPALVAFYREPRLFWITAALGLGFFLNGVGVQHSALIQRHMRFGAGAAIDIAALAASTAVGIGMAWRGFGYWALVGSSLVNPAVSSAGAWLVAGWIPGRPRRGAGVLSMLRFGGTVTLNSLLVYVAYNLDKVLLGRFAGADALGIYGRGYQLVSIPTDNLNGAVGGVAFSALSRVQGDPARFRNYFLKGYTLVLTVTLPITIGCAVFAGDIVVVALGAKWLRVVPLLRLLAPTILVFALINPLSWLMLAHDLAGRSLRIAMVIAPLVILAYALGLPYGATGVALAFSATMVLLAVPVTLWAVHATPVSMRDVVGVARRPLLSGLAATAATLLAWPLLAKVGPPLPRLFVESGLLFAAYAWTLLDVMGQKAFYWELFRSMTKRPSADAAT